MLIRPTATTTKTIVDFVVSCKRWTKDDIDYSQKSEFDPVRGEKLIITILVLQWLNKVASGSFLLLLLYLAVDLTSGCPPTPSG